MARKVKKKTATRRVRRIRRKVETRKTDKNSIYFAIIALIAVVLIIVYYFSINQGMQPYVNNGESPSVPPSPPANQPTQPTTIGGSCTTDSDCFITYCKGQTKDCVNTNQLSSYSNKCKTYSDWVVENKQDASTCGCVQNACTMK